MFGDLGPRLPGLCNRARRPCFSRWKIGFDCSVANLRVFCWDQLWVRMVPVGFFQSAKIKESGCSWTLEENSIVKVYVSAWNIFSGVWSKRLT